MAEDSSSSQLGRRAFLQGGTLVLAAASGDGCAPVPQENVAPLRIGMVTDLHYADKTPNRTRHYRETLAKLDEAAIQFAQDQPSFLVELGDLVDAADELEVEQGYLSTIDRAFSAVCADRHYVLGNHCVDLLKKEEFLGTVAQERSYYSFDREAFHFVVLDACFRSDGEPYGRKNSHWADANIPGAELEWLQADLDATDKWTVIFAHQRLDVSNDHGVKNCPEVRRILEASGKVLAAFQGHSHQNDLKLIGGIHYCTLHAMVEGSGAENNGYSLMEIALDGTIQLSGFRKQNSYLLERIG